MFSGPCPFVRGARLADCTPAVLAGKNAPTAWIYSSMLSLNWYAEAPIDFEHKNYLLLDYAMKVDEAYASLRLSPYLLWTERLVGDMDAFVASYRGFRSSVPRRLEGVEDGVPVWSELETPPLFSDLIDIIEYSRPVLESKIRVGYRLFERYPQILY